MRTRVELVIEVDHPETIDPSQHFVYYFADHLDPEYPDADLGEDHFVVSESWETVK